MKDVVIKAARMRGSTSKYWLPEYEDSQRCEMGKDISGTCRTIAKATINILLNLLPKEVAIS
ncbi:hypothetical protein GCM10009129_23330 [Psychrobacter aestuarii]|uniref:Uncharacterized protein n=2 Tax=Psychrobacter aestuarii TaxID=556327 RepID=A0ABN0W4J7_9GAMM